MSQESVVNICTLNVRVTVFCEDERTFVRGVRLDRVTDDGSLVPRIIKAI